MILKVKLRLCQLTVKHPEEIVVPLTNEEISSLWKDNKYWQRACCDILATISNNYPKTEIIKFIKKAICILPRIVRKTPISGILIFYTDANKSDMVGYKSGNTRKLVQSPYTFVQKAEFYAILVVPKDFTEPVNIVMDSQFSERVILHIKTAELTSLFLQLQDTLRNRTSSYIYITSDPIQVYEVL